MNLQFEDQFYISTSMKSCVNALKENNIQRAIKTSLNNLENGLINMLVGGGECDNLS
jgi:hypothetical protein